MSRWGRLDPPGPARSARPRSCRKPTAGRPGPHRRGGNSLALCRRRSLPQTKGCARTVSCLDIRTGRCNCFHGKPFLKETKRHWREWVQASNLQWVCPFYFLEEHVEEGSPTRAIIERLSSRGAVCRRLRGSWSAVNSCKQRLFRTLRYSGAYQSYRRFSSKAGPNANRSVQTTGQRGIQNFVGAPRDGTARAPRLLIPPRLRPPAGWPHTSSATGTRCWCRPGRRSPSRRRAGVPEFRESDSSPAHTGPQKTSTSRENGPSRRKRTRTDSRSTAPCDWRSSRMPSTTGGELFGRRLVAKPDDRMEPEFVARRDRLQADVGDMAVGNAHDRAVEGTDARRAQADVVNGAGDLAHLQEVSNPHRLVEDEGRAGDDVLERLLRRQRHRDPADAESRQRGRGIDAEVAKRHEQRHEDHQHVDASPPDSQQGNGGGVGGGKPAESMRFDLAVEEHQQPGARDDGEESGRVGRNSRKSRDKGRLGRRNRLTTARSSRRAGAGKAFRPPSSGTLNRRRHASGLGASEDD